MLFRSIFPPSFAKANSKPSQSPTTSKPSTKQSTRARSTQKPPQSSPPPIPLSFINAISKLEPDIQAVLKTLAAKKSQLAADGLTSTVQGDLAALKKDTDSFAGALIAIASSDTTTKAKSAKSTNDGYFTSAINSFAS